MLHSLASDADGILVIAPETDACLANSIGWLGNQQHKLISPSLDFVVLTSNKNRLAEHLNRKGFGEIPLGMDLTSFLDLTDQQQAAWLPIIVKPADGAGSEGVEYFETKAELRGWLAENSDASMADFRAEQFLPGTPASIAVICRAEQRPIFFSAMKQILHPPPVGEYLRSEDCLSDSQQASCKGTGSSSRRLSPSDNWLYRTGYRAG